MTGRQSAFALGLRPPRPAADWGWRQSLLLLKIDGRGDVYVHRCAGLGLPLGHLSFTSRRDGSAMSDATNAQNATPPESDSGSSPPRVAGEHAANDLGPGGQVTGGRVTGGPGGHAPGSGPSRRQVLAGAGGVGLLVAAR